MTTTAAFPHRPYRLWLGFALAAVAVVTVGWLAWHFLLRPVRIHGEWSKRVNADLMLLVAKRPAEVPLGQWEFLVGWTINLHANCGSDYFGITDRAHAERFAEALEERLKHPLDVATIDWIWDEYEQFTTGGRSYSDKYRPTRSPDLEYAQPDCFNLHVK